jgi:hypothetical protein
MAISFAQAVQELLAGKALAWSTFGDHQAGSITLAAPLQRRLFAFLLAQPSAKVAEGSEDLFVGLTAAWSDKKTDPATNDTASVVQGSFEAWRLERIEASAFGGLTLFEGNNFDFWTAGDNWCLLGQNGSGKTSLASAILWALTGKRIREQDGPVDETGARAPVYNPDGKKIGDWPPFASYPASPIDLAKPVEVWVRLTFRNASSETATAYRKMTCPPTGVATVDVQVDPKLLRAPQLIETGLLMPARLVRTGFGDKSQSLYGAVKVLTGLDQLSDIAEGCVHFTHGGRRFLLYGKHNGIDGFKARFDENMQRAKAKAAKLGFALPSENNIDDTNIVAALQAVAASASTEAGTHLATLKSEIAATIDTATPQGRTTVRTAVNTARGVVTQQTNGITAFSAWAALKSASESAVFSELPAVIADARARLTIALTWHARQNEDQKFRLKALAAQFFVPPHAHGEIAQCPVCAAALTTDEQKQLAADLAELQKDAAEAERKLEDVCRALGAKLVTHLPQGLQRYMDLLAIMNPKDSYLAAMRDRFCVAAPFKDTLVGLSAAVETVSTAQYATLPDFTYPAFQKSSSEPQAAIELRESLHRYERLIALASWWSGHRQQFVESWISLIGREQNGSFPGNSIEAHLLALEQALLKAEPLDELSKFLLAAATAAANWAPIHSKQKQREAIAQALAPLKELRLLVGAETARSIDSLSDRMKAILERIHHHERLTYEQTTVSKKAVTVDGSFEPGMQIDATHVANTSWLRAMLWAFVLALREETVASLGTNPFPLMVLDDPQTTFDPRNKLKWAEEIARLANLDPALPEGLQLFLTTHERHFYQCMVDHQILKGEQGLIGGVNKASGVAKIVNGGSLDRVFREANDNNDDARARDYIGEVRIYCEDLLKCVLRGEGPRIPDLTLGDLTKELKRLKAARTPPFDRSPFEDLLNTLAGGGGKEMKLINIVHHKDDETVGLAQAKDVKAFWENTLRTQIHDAFELYDNFGSFYGEPRSFPWAKNVIPFPGGFREVVKASTMQQTGVAAAAKTDGVAGDGIVTVEEWDNGTKVVLPNHEIYQLAAGTLDPVAGIGDLLIVSNYAPIHHRNLVVATVGDALLARRYNHVEAHPDIAVLTGQSVDPTALVKPVIVALKPDNCRKVVGTLFVAHKLSIPPLDRKREIVPLVDSAIIDGTLGGARLFQVKGRSAEPIALNGQFLITHGGTSTLAGFEALDGCLVVAVDENGTRYFKRLRCNGSLMILESLNPDGTTAAEVLSTDGELGLPRLNHALEVAGVLFELPDAKGET